MANSPATDAKTIVGWRVRYEDAGETITRPYEDCPSHADRADAIDAMASLQDPDVRRTARLVRVVRRKREDWIAVVHGTTVVATDPPTRVATISLCEESPLKIGDRVTVRRARKP